MANKIPTINGEFIGAKLSGDHVTVWIEGRDEDGPSVSGTSLDEAALEELIVRLTVLKINHFRGRTPKKPDRRQDTRRQNDKTVKKLKAIYPMEPCFMCQDRPGIHSGICNTCAIGQE